MKTLLPPIAAKRPHKISVHGDTWTDNYFWLKEKSNPEVIRYLNAENDYTARVMKPYDDLAAKLNREMVRRIVEDDESVPVRKGANFYYTRQRKGFQYEIHCRKMGTLRAQEQVILDVNELARGKRYMRVGDCEISPDQRYLAYSTDAKGDELFTIRIKDLTTGKLLADKVENAYYSMAWSADNHFLFYTTVDAALRPYRVWKHAVGTSSEKDVLVWEETDERFTAGVEASKDHQFVFVLLQSMVTSEVRYLGNGGTDEHLKIVVPRRQDIEYSVVHRQGLFYIRINDRGRNFRLVSAPVEQLPKANWTEVLPHNSDVCLEGLEEFSSHLAIEAKQDGLNQILIYNCKTGATHKVRFPEAAYGVKIESNPEFESTVLRFVYSSMVTPPSVYDYQMNTRQRELKKQDRIRGGYDAAEFKTERIFATAADGTKVPISIAYRRGVKRDGKAPALLYGYGAYGYSRDAEFSTTRLSLLTRGFIYAIAHIRGGAEMGEAWHDDGKLLLKKNTFTDFIACGEHLVAQKYTSPAKLMIQGGSAGGLLMGAVVNMRPDLFHTAVAMVPFVDVVSTMLDSTLPLTVGEYEEWGNPNEKRFYRCIKSYSPYDNVEAKVYPNMLVTAGLNDPRVQYWEPAKWVAKLRALNKGKNLLLLKTNMGGGHFGKSGRYDKFQEVAFEYAFMLRTAGLAK